MNGLLMKRLTLVLTFVLLITSGTVSCAPAKERVLIYTSAEDFRVEHMRQCLTEQFPQYNIVIEYMPTGNHAAKILAEGKATDCDITHNMEYTYLEKMETDGLLADLSSYDFSVFCDDVNRSKSYMAVYRNGGGIIINPAVLEANGLPVPTCYDDLLDPQYRGLISMPNPKSSGTGYMFLLALVNERGEEAAFAYFDQLSENILQFTSSGAGPVNALVQGEVAIGLGMIGTAVKAINDGTELDIIFFEEGAPFSLYGQAIMQGKETRPAVQEVFDYLYNTYGYLNCENFFPEPIYANRTFTVENYPAQIPYSDMSNDTVAMKDQLLAKWKH